MSGLQTTTTSQDVDLHLIELSNADTTRLTFMGRAGFSVTFNINDRDLAKFANSICDYLKLKANSK